MSGDVDILDRLAEAAHAVTVGPDRVALRIPDFDALMRIRRYARGELAEAADPEWTREEQLARFSAMCIVATVPPGGPLRVRSEDEWLALLITQDAAIPDLPALVAGALTVCGFRALVDAAEADPEGVPDAPLAAVAAADEDLGDLPT